MDSKQLFDFAVEVTRAQAQEARETVITPRRRARPDRDRYEKQRRYRPVPGDTYGEWTVVGPECYSNGIRYIQAQCSCGKLSSVRVKLICTGKTASCGHRPAAKAERAIWRAMRARCLNPSYSGYENYGGRGITICPEWDDAEQFLKDMGPRPSLEHSLDRIDNSKGYSKENCRWATPLEQHNNTRRNIFLEYDGKRMTIAQWAREMGINYGTIISRYDKGWAVENILTEYRWKVEGGRRADDPSKVRPPVRG